MNRAMTVNLIQPPRGLQRSTCKNSQSKEPINSRSSSVEMNNQPALWLTTFPRQFSVRRYRSSRIHDIYLMKASPTIATAETMTSFAENLMYRHHHSRRILVAEPVKAVTRRIYINPGKARRYNTKGFSFLSLHLHFHHNRWFIFGIGRIESPVLWARVIRIPLQSYILWSFGQCRFLTR